MIMEATEAAGYLDKVSVGLDVASSEFKVPGENAYDLDFKTTGPDKDTSMKLSGDELMAMYADISNRYPIVTIEDPFDQEDWENWSKFTAMIGEDVQARAHRCARRTRTCRCAPRSSRSRLVRSLDRTA
jgi:enolase